MDHRRHPCSTVRRRLLVFVATLMAAAAFLAPSPASSADAVCATPPPSTIQAQPGVVTSGTAGADVIYGTTGDDRIVGLGGNDIIIGFGGNDRLSGGDGNDTLCGGSGNDWLSGGNGNDSLSGEAGNDDLSGDLGDDRLFGDSGDDRLAGGGGTDSCNTGGQAGDAVPPPPNCDTVIATTTTTSTTRTTSTTTSTTSTTSTTLRPVATPAIFLGFADTLHDVLPFLADPWQGDPGVVFLGCTLNTVECGPAYQAGAIRVDNPVGNPALTLTSARVEIETCTWQLWEEFLPATVQPGEMLILTQSGVLGPPQPPPCDRSMAPADRPHTNFDTNAGPFDDRETRFFNCDPTLVDRPVITLTFSDGMTLVVTDANEVLSTGGVDRFACTGQGDGTPWTAVPAGDVVRVG